ncbi:hypothetical protein Pmani_005050 [Petrolisthes manimaculis]|uniref:Fucosyltransferase n=1 Tax=Petrolisthes manimaculis TaxID=1843537 RepID=A0AAE1UH04_9EUCA|nr:hypothetical protein Pmani_005050 [Petrolisthes manimaculis]
MYLICQFAGRADFGFGVGREPFIRAKCPINTCYITTDHNLFPARQVDALVVHPFYSFSKLPSERWPHTRYVFLCMEAPIRLPHMERYKRTFNWTFTHRYYSDIQNWFYGRVQPRVSLLPKTNTNYAEGKTKIAAWLVKTLKKWIPVDTYGACGELKCPKNESRQCKQMLTKHYKFYLSLENSLCRDYVTEKFYGILK